MFLKRLSDAIADGDPIRGVIRNTAWNHSGRGPTISAPSRRAQVDLLKTVHHGIGLDPAETAFVEVSCGRERYVLMPSWH
jgi:acyl transferase domain-containing protein